MRVLVTWTQGVTVPHLTRRLAAMTAHHEGCELVYQGWSPTDGQLTGTARDTLHDDIDPSTTVRMLDPARKLPPTQLFDLMLLGHTQVQTALDQEVARTLESTHCAMWLPRNPVVPESPRMYAGIDIYNAPVSHEIARLAGDWASLLGMDLHLVYGSTDLTSSDATDSARQRVAHFMKTMVPAHVRGACHARATTYLNALKEAAGNDPHLVVLGNRGRRDQFVGHLDFFGSRRSNQGTADRMTAVDLMFLPTRRLDHT